jgi:SAM-dependent methyltransferase
MSSLPVSGPIAVDDSTLRVLLTEYRRRNWQGIQTPEWQRRIVEDILQDDGGEVLRQIGSFWKLPGHAKVLDVGSGVGSFVVGCRRRGINAFGIEPDRIGQGGNITSIEIARRRLEVPVFAAAMGENLPFADNTFDLVTMNQVIEHVSEQRAVLREALRVLKVQGALYLACPNYLRFYEPHYKLRWFPLLPKWAGRLYLKLRGRDPVMLAQLTYTTNARLRALFHALPPHVRIIDIHREQFLRKLAHGGFVSRRARWLAKVTRLPLFGPLVTRFALSFRRLTEGGCEMLVVKQSGPAGS